MMYMEDFMNPIITREPGDNHPKRFRSLLLCLVMCVTSVDCC